MSQLTQGQIPWIQRAQGHRQFQTEEEAIYLGVSGEIQGWCGQDLLRKRWGWGGVKSGHRR